MNRKNTKRALLSSVLALVLCLSMLVGSTFAWFTDNASTSVNTIQSGKLDVALEMATAWGEDGVPTAWETAEGKTLNFKKAAGAPAEEAILWEPGAEYALNDLRIVNKGNLALKYQVVITGIEGDAKLLEAIDWTIGYGYAEGAAEGQLAAGTSAEITVTGKMKEEAGNEYMDQTIEGVAITVLATQLASEFDSNDNQYDAGALYSEPIEVKAGESKVIDLTGKKYVASGYDAVVFANGGEITLNGKGTVAAVQEDQWAYAVWARNGGKITINDGMYTHAKAADEPALIYASGQGSVVEINGGVFKAFDPKWTLNLGDNSGAQIIVKGGSFYQFDPSNADTEPAPDKPHNFVAEGYDVIQQGDWYVVVEKADAYISSAEDLRAFAAEVNKAKTSYAGKTIRLVADIDLAGENWTPINGWNGVLNGTIIDGNGFAIKNMKVDGGDSAGFISNNASSVTIKDLTFENAYVKTADGNSKYAGVVMGKNYSLSTIENVKVVNSQVRCTWQCGGLVGFAEGKAPAFINCSIEDSFVGGYNSTAGAIFGLGGVDVTMTNCTAKNVALYTDGQTWESTQKPGGEKFLVGHLYGKTLTLNDWTMENVTVVSAYPA